MATMKPMQQRGPADNELFTANFTGVGCLYMLIEQRRRQRPLFLSRNLAYLTKRQKLETRKSKISHDVERILERVERESYSIFVQPPSRRLRLGQLMIQACDLSSLGRAGIFCEITLLEVGFRMRHMPTEPLTLIERHRLRLPVHDRPSGDRNGEQRTRPGSLDSHVIEFPPECFENEARARNYMLTFSICLGATGKSRFADVASLIDPDGSNLFVSEQKADPRTFMEAKPDAYSRYDGESSSVMGADLSLTVNDGQLLPNGFYEIALKPLGSFQNNARAASKMSVQFNLGWSVQRKIREAVSDPPFLPSVIATRHPPSGRPMSVVVPFEPQMPRKIVHIERPRAPRPTIQYCFQRSTDSKEPPLMAYPYKDAVCPWCLTTFIDVHSLIYHLVCSHDRLNFTVNKLAQSWSSLVHIFVFLNFDHRDADHFLSLNHGYIPADFYFYRRPAERAGYLGKARDPSVVIPDIPRPTSMSMPVVMHADAGGTFSVHDRRGSDSGEAGKKNLKRAKLDHPADANSISSSSSSSSASISGLAGKKSNAGDQMTTAMQNSGNNQEVQGHAAGQIKLRNFGNRNLHSAKGKVVSSSSLSAGVTNTAAAASAESGSAAGSPSLRSERRASGSFDTPSPSATYNMTTSAATTAAATATSAVAASGSDVVGMIDRKASSQTKGSNSQHHHHGHQRQVSSSSGSKSALRKDAIRRSITPVPVENRFYHTQTLQPVSTTESEEDSEDEPSMEWLHRLDSMCIDEFTDVNDGEKKLMKLWNRHIRENIPGVFGDCHLPASLEVFAQKYGATILSNRLRNNFALHLLNLGEQGLVSQAGIVHTLKIVDAANVHAAGTVATSLVSPSLPSLAA